MPSIWLPMFGVRALPAMLVGTRISPEKIKMLIPLGLHDELR
jgi:hypothetical protein